MELRHLADRTQRLGCYLYLFTLPYLSIGGFHHDLVATHVALLRAGIWVVEGLYLGEVAAGNYEMICLPMKLRGADGAPARVLLRC